MPESFRLMVIAPAGFTLTAYREQLSVKVAYIFYRGKEEEVTSFIARLHFAGIKHTTDIIVNIMIHSIVSFFFNLKF